MSWMANIQPKLSKLKKKGIFVCFCSILKGFLKKFFQFWLNVIVLQSNTLSFRDVLQIFYTPDTAVGGVTI